jgi:fatty-acyl-CoA synthase
MTELSPVATLMGPSAPFEKKVTTVGRAAPMTEIKLIDEKGKIVPRGEEGEVCVRGYLVMKEYWDEPEKTKEAKDANGWMHSGDLAKLDEDGYL